MRNKIRTAIAACVAMIVLTASATMALAADGDSAEPSPTETTATPSEPAPEVTTPTTARTITDAELRWGINNESNNKAPAPGTTNFFSAGKIGNPGSGGKLISTSDQGATWNNGRAAGWQAEDGNVSIEKYLNEAWKPATFEGLKTTSTGETMTGSNGFSNHQIVLSNGTGTVDRAAGTVSIQWTGSFTVVYYSGYSFFYVTDPKLTITDGVGKLTATLSGYGSSIDDLSKWDAVTPVPNVVLANLPKVDLDSGNGFSSTPAYTKVAVSLSDDQSPQNRTGPDWGSFPQSFIDYQIINGTGSYWYSSGGAADTHKIALPITVSYSAAAPVKVTPPSTKGNTTTKIDNSAPKAPKTTVSTPSASSAPPVTSAPATVAAPALPEDVIQSSGVTTQFHPVSTITGVRQTTGPSVPQGIWVLGGILLGAALLIGISPVAYAASRRPS